jgi:cysteine synthase
VIDATILDRGWFPTEQFSKTANPHVHELTTGPEIVAQCGAQLGAFVCGVGTCGTITGVGRYLKTHARGAKVILADPIGPDSRTWLTQNTQITTRVTPCEGIGGSEAPAVLDLSIIDAAERVSDEESFALPFRLIREEGLLVGGSSGTAVAAAFRVAARGDVTGPVVAILADSGDRYFSTSWMRGPFLEHAAGSEQRR